MGLLDPKPISAAAIAAQVANPASVIGSQLTATFVPRSMRTYEDIRDYLPGGYVAGDDATAALQSAVTAAASVSGRGQVVIVGDYYIPGTISVTGTVKGVKISGTGAGDHAGYNWHSRLWTDSPTGTLFSLTESGCVFEDIFLENTSPTTPTAGYGITGTTIGGLRINRTVVKGFYIPVDASQAQEWSMTSSVIRDWVAYGMKIRNTFQPDSGDQSISDSWFSFFTSAHAGGPAIRYESGGGLKISNTKFNGPGGAFMEKCLDLSLTDTTTDLLIANCSFENYNTHGIHIRQSGASTATFGHISLVGNQFASYSPAATLNDIRIDPANGVRPFKHITIVGTFLAGGAGTQSSIYLSNVDNVSVSGTFEGYKRKIEQTACLRTPLEPTNDSYWIPATAFEPVFGAPTHGSVQRWPVMVMSGTVTQMAACALPQLPWGTIGGEAWWINSTANTGNIVMQITVDSKTYDGITSASGTGSGQQLTATAGAQYSLRRTYLAGPDGSYSLGVASNALTNIVFTRFGDHVADTLNYDIGLVGVMIRRTA